MKTAKSLSSLTAAQFLALVMPTGLYGGALIGQYAFGLFPCEMCWWQRYPHMAAIAFALMGFLTIYKRTSSALAAYAMLISGLIGGYHAGIEYKWWEGITTCTSTFSLGSVDPLEAILKAPMIRCDVAQWDLFGISLAGWNFLISCSSAAAIFTLLRKSSRKTPNPS